MSINPNAVAPVSPSDEWDAEATKVFLEKIKKYIDEKTELTFLNAEGVELPDAAGACTVVIMICGEEVSIPLKCCVSMCFMDANGDTIEGPDGASFVQFTVDGVPVTICLDKPLHVKVPDDVANPAAWIANNAADYPPGSHFYTGSDPLNPIAVWNTDAAGNVLCDKAPAPAHVQVPQGQDPALWIAANAAAHPPGTHFYTGADPLDPDGVWTTDVNGAVLCDKRPRPEHVAIPEGADPATWIAANYADYPADSHFYTGADPLNPEGVWNVDATGNILCDKTPAPEHVAIPAGEDPATWIAANYADYPADSHFYTGADPLNPEGVWNVDAAGNILCDKTPAPEHVQVPEGEDPATWIAANYADYPADSHFYTGDDPLNPLGVWNVDAAGNILCDKRPEPLHIQIPVGAIDPYQWVVNAAANYPPGTHFYRGTLENPNGGVYTSDANGDILCDKAPTPQHVQVPEGEDPAVWIAANFADYPADSHFYTGEDPLNPDGVWNVTAQGDVVCDKRPSPAHVQVPEGEDPAVWIAANFADYPADSHFYTGADPLNPDGVWNVTGDGDILCDKRPAGEEITLLGKGGAALNLATAELLTVADNPFVAHKCTKGGIELTKCDGTGICIVPAIAQPGFASGATAPPVAYETDAALTEGILADTEKCSNVNVPKCGPHRAYIYNQHSWSLPPQFQSAGLTFYPQMSVDGGATFSNMSTGGTDSANCPHPIDTSLNDPVNTKFGCGEQEFNDIQLAINLPGCEKITVCTRLSKNAGTLVNANINFNSSSHNVWFDTFRCCAI